MPVETRWAVTSRGGKKRIHRGDCKYARNPYNWAGDRTERELFDAIVESGSAHWHEAGKCCAEHLDWALYWITRKRVPVDMDFYIGKLSTEYVGA